MTTQSKFVIMKHEAKKAGLHYDLRFQMPRSKDWASFAVRKGVPTKLGVKVLAIRTTIHSEKEALFTGNIKDGYGAGKLTKWDSGFCIILKYSDKHTVIEFKGLKIKGIYHLLSTGVADKDFNKPTYFLFKGKNINEGTGMASRIPSSGLSCDMEEGSSEDTQTELPWSKNFFGDPPIVATVDDFAETDEGTGLSSRLPPKGRQEVEIEDEVADRQQEEPLSWSLAEAVNLRPQYAIVCQFISMKGFFKKKPTGEFLVLAIRDKEGFMILQFFQHIKENLFLVGLVGSGQSQNEEDLELIMDNLRYNKNVKILEDNLPIQIKVGTNINFIFTKVSKYLGKKLELIRDSRLTPGYFVGRCDIKEGFQPSIVYKISSGSFGLNLAKKMRAFTSSRFEKIMGKK
jgi:hypothetical protein